MRASVKPAELKGPRAEPLAGRGRVLAVMYADPANYPPTINTCRVLAAQGWTVEILGYSRGQHNLFVMGHGVKETYLNAGADAYPRALSSKLLELWRFREAVRAACERIQPSAIIAYDLYGVWGCAPLARRWPLIAHIHDLPAGRGGPRSLLGNRISAAAIRSARSWRAVVMPEARRIEIARREWMFHCPEFVVPNSPTRAGPARNSKLRERIIAQAKRAPRVLIVRAGGGGSVHMERESIEALRYLPPDHHLCLIGCGTSEYQSSLRAFAASNRVEDRTHLLPYVNYDEMRELLAGADVGLAIYRSGALDVNRRHLGPASVKFWEYLAAGMPRIVNRTTDFHDLAGLFEGTVVLNSESPQAVAAAVERAVELLRGNDLCARAMAAHQREFCYERHLSPLIAFLDELVNRRVGA